MTDTVRDRLIAAGEELFAREGFGRVRLRDLNASAEVKNDTAVHYYFGGQDGLLDAILQEHLTEISARVDTCTASLCAGRDGSPEALRDAIAALAIPFAEKLSDERGRRFIRIMAEVTGSGRPWPEGRYVSSSALAMDLIRRSLPDLDPDLREERVRLITPFVIACFADKASRPPEVETGSLHAFVFDVVQMAASAYLAPAPIGDFWPTDWPSVLGTTSSPA